MELCKRIFVKHTPFPFLAKLLILLSLGISSFQRLQPPDTLAAAGQLKRATAFLKNDRYAAALPLLRQALATFEQAGNYDSCITAYKKLDDCFSGLHREEEGRQFLETALQKPGLPAVVSANLLLLIADNYNTQSDYHSAVEAYEKGLPYAQNAQADPLLLHYYANLGWLYWNAGNHAKALEFEQKALQIAQIKRDTRIIAILLSNMGDTYRSMHDDPQALNCFRRSLALAPQQVQTRIQFSKAYQQAELPDSALFILRSVLPLLQDETDKADAYYQFAQLYLEARELSKAGNFINQALHYGRLGYGEKHQEYARMTRLAGKIYLALGDADKSLRWFDQTLIAQSLQDTECRHPENLAVGDLSPGSYWVLGSLEGKGEAFFRKYQQSKNEIYLHSALAAFDLGMLYGEKMRLADNQESAKLELYEYVQPIIEGGIKTALALAASTGDNVFIEKAYLFAERAKAPVMAEALYDQGIKHVAGIPDSLLAREKMVQEIIVQQELALHEQPRTDSLRNQLLETKLGFEQLEADIQARFPRYFALKYAFSKQSDLSQIRSHLPDNALLIQYFVGASTLYSFAVSKDNIRADSLPLNEEVYATLEKFRRSVSDWDFVKYSANQAEQDFLTTAPVLYEWLLARQLAIGKAHRLIIVPDGYLGLIPFEAIFTAPYSGSWKDLQAPYLIRDYAVDYAWSASAFQQMNPATKAPRYNFVGIGTEYNTGSMDDTNTLAMRDLGPLPNADDEVEAIDKIMQGKTWLNAAATKANFLASAPDCGILHVATHGIMDEQDPMSSYLVFNKSEQGGDNRLFASELYNLQLQAQMTVLSACHTSQGKVHNGEGVMSLARAFAFAGCRTLVGSLWSVNDRSTSQIMQGFYQALETGKPVDESLQMAKLEYLKTTSSEYAKPIYWAGFVVIGDSDPLPWNLFHSKRNPVWWIVAGCFLVTGCFYLLRKRFRK
ncbi:MAG: CHAT domain-containing tetratricopeptide repeat protein [Saprospiraceae bacterium]